MNFQKKIYGLVEETEEKNIAGNIYDYITMVVIVVSLVPLAFKQSYRAFEIIDYVCVSIFIVDYILRWITADYKFGKHNAFSFLRYPFSFMAIIDLISIIPSFVALNQSFKLLRIIRLIRAFRVFRVFKAFRYSRSLQLIAKVLKRTRTSLISVGTIAIGYVLVSALIIINVEPDSFNSFFDAVYWATISLTTVGYGDIYATSTVGKIVTMISSLFGIAIIALPSGIITAGFMRVLEEMDAAAKPKTKRKKKRSSKVLSEALPNDVTESVAVRDEELSVNETDIEVPNP